MRNFDSSKLILLIGQLERNLAYLYKYKGQDSKRRRYAIQHLADIRKQALKYGLEITAASARQSSLHLRHRDDYTELRGRMEEITGALRRILTWEVERLVCFEIPSTQVHYWTDKRPFDPIVYKRFPKSEWDIEHASKCMAVGRYTASVFHLMCAIDVALQRIAKRFKIKVTLSMTWSNIIRKLSNKIDQIYPVKKPGQPKPPELKNRQKLRRARYEEILLLLDRIREAWRNETMHSRYHYEENEAQEIFDAVRAFMLRVAKVI
jgi:hypothetical protein